MVVAGWGYGFFVMATNKNRNLSFLTCASDAAVLAQQLLASPCLAGDEYALEVYAGVTSAVAAFNAKMARVPCCPISQVGDITIQCRGLRETEYL